MSRQYIFVAAFATLVFSGSCFSGLEQASYSVYYPHKVNANGHSRFPTQKKSNQKPIDRDGNQLEGELSSAKGQKPPTSPAKPNEINVDHFGAKGDGSDDTEVIGSKSIKAFIGAWFKACSSTSDQTSFLVPARKEYNLKPITFTGPCKSPITINIHGTISGSKNLADYKYNITRYWLIFENITDLTVHGGGTIDGNGQVWWPKRCKRDKTIPCENGAKALSFKGCTNLTMTDLNFINPQQMHLHIENCNNVEVSHIMINAPGDSPNTDGIHVLGSRDVRIKHCGIHTGDDCISIIAGSHHIEVTDINCGPGHGISIGSLGKDGASDAVSNIKVNETAITGAENGVRIKTWQGGKGLTENIIFEDIVMQDVMNPIIIDQFYCDKEGQCLKQNEAVKIKTVIFKNITGTSATQTGMALNCSPIFPCEGIQLENIELTYKGGTSLATCSNANVTQKGIVSPQCP